jgi:hypothetical protein
MTPAMLDRIARRKMAAQAREDLLFGILNSTIANYSIGAPEEPKQPRDFMLRPAKKSVEAQPTTSQQQAAQEAAQQAEHVRMKLIRMFGNQPPPTIGGR